MDVARSCSIKYFFVFWGNCLKVFRGPAMAEVTVTCHMLNPGCTIFLRQTARLEPQAVVLNRNRWLRCK